MRNRAGLRTFEPKYVKASLAVSFKETVTAAGFNDFEEPAVHAKLGTNNHFDVELVSS